MLNHYETVFITTPVLSEQQIKEAVEKFKNTITDNGGTIEHEEAWGLRKLAYPINDKPEGYYVVATFKSAPDFPSELDRNYNIDESIMRSLIVKLEFEAVKHEAPVVEETAAATEAPATEEVAATEEAVSAETATDAE